MASAEHEIIMGVWGRNPSGVQGQSPRSEGRGLPPEAESFLTFGRPREVVTFESFTISWKVSTPDFLHPFLTFT